MRRILVLVLALCALFAPRFAWAKASHLGEASRLEVPGAPDAFYFRPRGKAAKPVIMYLHGRGGNPAEDCRKWAKVAADFGWVVCPQGPEDRGAGQRGWANGAEGAKKIIDATMGALRAKFKTRVRRSGNILIGFSEGAFIAQQVGLSDARTWGRWLVLAASDQYWVGDTQATLAQQRSKLRKVYLLTGENDGVASNSTRVHDTLKQSRIPVKLNLVPGLGHEIPGDRMVTLYRRPLAWLASGK
jgi:predicted esterase